MECSCQLWKNREIKLSCAQCHGYVHYIKVINNINEDDENKIKLLKLKKDLESKRADIQILKMEIRELEDIINDNEDKTK